MAKFETFNVCTTTNHRLKFFSVSAGIGESLAYANGVAMAWPLAYLWHIHGVPMAYLRNSFVLSGIDFIVGMVLV